MGDLKSGKNLVLVGGGYAHLIVLKRLLRRCPAGVNLTLVSPFERQVCAGMVPAMIAGRQSLNTIQIDLKALVTKAGGQFLPGRALEVALPNQLRCDTGDELAFDVISFDIGSLPRGFEIAAGSPRVIFAKPIQNLLRLLEEPWALARPPAKELISLAIVGGGAAGVELALALHRRFLDKKRALKVTILDSGDRMFPACPARFTDRIQGILKQRGIEVKLRHEVTGIADGWIQLASRPPLPFDYAIWTTGPGAPGIFRLSGLNTDGRGFLLVNKYLQSVSHPSIFGGGDCVTTQEAIGHAKAGVYAMQQGPVLAHNLLAVLLGKSLIAFKSKPKCLSILNTADGKAVSNRFGWYSRFERRWKDRIDHRFMKRFRQFQEPDGA